MSVWLNSDGPPVIPWWAQTPFLVNFKINRKWFGIRLAIPNPGRLIYNRRIHRRHDEIKRGILEVTWQHPRTGIWE